MKITLTFGRNAQLIWALILPAFMLLIPLILIIEFVFPLYPNNSGLLIGMATIGYLALYIWITYSWVKATTAEVEITLQSNELHFCFEKKNVFHPTDFKLTLGEIKNLSEDDDKGYQFLYFDCNNSDYSKFYLRCKIDHPEFDAFRNELLAKYSHRIQN